MLPQKDILILRELRQNARETLTNMSKHTKIPVSTLYDRLQMREKDIIRKHTAILDFAYLGYSTRANVFLSVEKEFRDALKRELLKSRHVNSLFKINNGYDFLMECIFHQMKELEDFLEELETQYRLKDIKVHYIVEDIKREAFMSEAVDAEA
ncbi:hypothetical protein HZB01_05340 [Candidatus Woesearchaeota archaeon]|nr:hypothetical protein [Candidatus Woesearchaeota archaeon]